MTNQKIRGEEREVPGWLELYDLSLHTDVEASVPKGAYIRGIVGIETRFEPRTLILGNALKKAPESNVAPGWVELKTIEFHRDVEGVSLIPPYVHGVMDEEGHFYPEEPLKIINELEEIQ